MQTEVDRRESRTTDMLRPWFPNGPNTLGANAVRLSHSAIRVSAAAIPGKIGVPDKVGSLAAGTGAGIVRAAADGEGKAALQRHDAGQVPPRPRRVCIAAAARTSPVARTGWRA